MKPLILCLGNDVLSDDGFGFAVADRLHEKYNVIEVADVSAVPIAGFALLDALDRRDHVLIVDTIQTRTSAPGTLLEYHAGQYTPSKNLTMSHQISLPHALALGRELGYTMPVQIDVLAVEAEDLETLEESLTPAVKASVEPAVEWIERWVFSLPELHKERQYDNRIPQPK